MTKEIFLTKGFVAIVDDEDYEEISQWLWYPQKGVNTYYAVRNSYVSEDFEKRKSISMHRQILDFPPYHVDHKDGNGLYNVRLNLRKSSKAQNAHNQKPQRGRSSKYKGVRWHKHSERWTARITHKGNAFFLGAFHCEKEAAEAYNKAALNYFGEYAKLNEVSNG